MTKFKKIVAAAFLLSAVLTLSGCYPTGEKPLPPTSDVQGSDQGDPSGDPETTQPFVGTVSKKVGDVEFNYDISADLPTQATKIKLKPKDLDKELVKNVLLSGKTVISEYENYRFETSDGSLLCFWDGGSYIDFSDGKVDDSRNNVITIPNSYDYFCYSNSKQLKSFSSQNAVERVNKLLDEIGVENYGEPCIIPVSAETGNAHLKEDGVFTTNKDQSKDDYDLWTEDDELYILKYRFKFNGTDLCSGKLKTLGTAKSIQGAEITAYVNKDTIFHLEIHSWYDVVSLDEGMVDFKFNAGHASNALIDHYSKLASVKYPTFFTECKLEYVPTEYAENNEIIFMPAWCFIGYQQKGLTADIPIDIPRDFAEYYYAETGIRAGSF